MDVQAAHFSAIERTRAPAPEDSELIAGFVDCTVAVNAFRNGKSRAARAGRGYEFRCGTRAKAGKMRRIVPRRKNLQHAEAVLAVRDEGKSARGHHSNFYVIDVVELAIGSEELIEFRRVGFFDVNDGESLLPCGNVGVRARKINVAGVLERNESVADWFWLRKVSNVKDFQAVAIHNERVAELHSDAARIVERWRADGCGDARSERIVEIHDDKSFVREDVGK